VIRYQGQCLELAEYSTLIPPTELALPDLLVALHQYFPRSPQRMDHPRWALAVREFRTFLWEMTGLRPAHGPLWGMVVQPVLEPVIRAWEEEDWEGFQSAIAAGKEEIASLQLSGILASGVMEMVEGTA
jgi:hypothetical protein